MGELWMIAVAIVLLLVAVFIIKTVVKTALRMGLLAILAVVALLYYTGNLPF
jgi:hypothetical protein